jgi:response regulator RpfG family c-di-GMP phosphodiesterase
VVDDERGVREVLRRVLTLDGYEVQTADGGAEALGVVIVLVGEVVVDGAGVVLVGAVVVDGVVVVVVGVLAGVVA